MSRRPLFIFPRRKGKDRRLGRTVWDKLRDILTLVIQCGILVVLGLTCYSNCKLTKATREYTNKTGELLEVSKTEADENIQVRVATEKLASETEKLRKVTAGYANDTYLLRRATEKNTNQLREQFNLSIEPRVYGDLFTRDRYLNWFNEETGSSIKNDQETGEETQAKGFCDIFCYIGVENPTRNMALNVTAFFYPGIEKVIKGPLHMRDYVKPSAFAFFIILDTLFNARELEKRLLQFYSEKDTAIILDSGHLTATGNKPYLVIIYKDLLGNLYVNKTTYRISAPDFGKAHLSAEKIGNFKLAKHP